MQVAFKVCSEAQALLQGARVFCFVQELAHLGAVHRGELRRAVQEERGVSAGRLADPLGEARVPR